MHALLLAVALATPAAAPPASPVPVVAPSIAPATIPTLPPVTSSSDDAPYPAFGTPIPGLDRGVAPAAGVSQALTIQQAVLIAFAQSPVLASARADVANARAPLELAQTAIFPNITGTLSTTRAHRQPTGTATTGGTTGANNGTTTTTPSGGFVADTTSNVASVALRQLIFDGGRVAAQIRAARANLGAASFTYQRQLQTVANNVAQAYYGALAAQRQRQVAFESLKNAQTQEALVNAQIRAGTAARADLSTAQFQTAQARLSVVRAQANELNALSSFANTLGLEANTYVQPTDDVPPDLSQVQPTVTAPSYDVAVTRAYALRPDLAASQQSIASQEASLRAARLGNFPTLNGSAGATTASTDPGGGNYRNNSNVGLALTIPIFDQGVTRAQTAQQQALLDRVRAQDQIVRLGAQLNIKQSLVTLVSARSALDQANAEVTKAQDVLRSTQAQYRAGVTTLPLLLNAQVALTTALTDQVTAVYALRQAEAAFLYAEGANVGG